MILKPEVQIWKFFSKVIFEYLIGEGVASLVETIAITMDLQTIIRQVNVIVIALECVLIAACSNIPISAHVDLKVVSHQHQNSDIELSVFIEKWPLEVFLNNPLSFDLLGFDEPLDLLDGVEDLDASTLVQPRRFHQSESLLALLLREIFLELATSLSLVGMELKNFHRRRLVKSRFHNEGQRG